jgi:hypothetical protein
MGVYGEKWRGIRDVSEGPVSMAAQRSQVYACGFAAERCRHAGWVGRDGEFVLVFTMKTLSIRRFEVDIYTKSSL